MSPPPVYRALADELAALGTEAIFGLVGEDTVSFVTAATRAGIAFHAARHENIAVGMADGYAWRSGGIGIGTVTRGPGLLNAALAIRTAARAGRRVLVITGDVPAGGDRRWDFKAIEHAPLVAALGAEHRSAGSPADVVGALHDALAAVRAGHTTVLSVPVDVLHAPFAEPSAAAMPAPASEAREPPEPPEEQIAQAAGLLAAAERPLVLAGRGAAAPLARDALARLAERSGALLGTSLLARDLFNGHPHDLGIVGGFSSDPAVPALAEVDCVIAFGASLNPWTTGGGTLFRDAAVIQVDRDAAALGASRPIRLGIHADALVTARRLLAALPARAGERNSIHRDGTLERLRDPLWAGPDESTSDALDPRAITTTLDALLPEARTIVLDSGRHLTSAGRFMRFLAPDRFRLTADAGAIGMGLGIALGAQAARPGETTVLFVGDGGLSMTVGDLETAVRNRLPLIVVVMNDAAYGSELVHLEAAGLEWDHATLPELDFAATARSFGIEAATVRTLDELRAHAAALEHRTAPLLLDCRVRRDLFVSRVSW